MQHPLFYVGLWEDWKTGQHMPKSSSSWITRRISMRSAQRINDKAAQAHPLTAKAVSTPACVSQWNDTSRDNSRSHMWHRDGLQRCLLVLSKLCNVNFTGWQSASPFNPPPPTTLRCEPLPLLLSHSILTSLHVCSCIISVTFPLTVHAPSWLFFYDNQLPLPGRVGTLDVIFDGGEEEEDRLEYYHRPPGTSSNCHLKSSLL